MSRQFGWATGGFLGTESVQRLGQPTRAAHSTTAVSHFLWGPLTDTTSANLASQLFRRNVVTISWNDGSRLRRYHGRWGNRTHWCPAMSNHSTIRLYRINATGAVRRTALGSRLAGSSNPKTCLAPSKVT